MPEKQTADQPAHSPRVDAAFWEVPGANWKIIYLLPVFHEIDFLVNEGYRKIPHGGIEEGGLLFGGIDDEVVRIEAFRRIECEHVAGPSLHLSERDLARLEEQLAQYKSDKELEKMEPIGWFLAHTRSSLEMSEIEANHFDRFFPGPKQVALLVKPERFQPTRFGFLTRNAGGELNRDATSAAIILPLPGRGHKSGELIPSIPAPKPTANAKLASQRALDEEFQAEADNELTESGPTARIATAERLAAPEPPKRMAPEPSGTWKPTEPEPLSIWKIPPDADLTEAEAEERIENLDPNAGGRNAEEKQSRKQLARDRARVIDEAYRIPESSPAPPPPPVFRPAPLPSLPANATRGSYRSGVAQHASQEATANEPMLSVRTVTALIMAALLGCLVGYIAYLQLPSPVIALDVKPVNQTMEVSWPAEETRSAIYAAIRLNDGPPVPLSAEEKKLGRVSLTASKDFKVEVVARNWIRDSRGIVRYVHTSGKNGKVLPSQTSTLP